MKPLLILHPPFIFILLLISTNTPTCLCEDDVQYRNCSNAFICGSSNLDLKYPFWGVNRDKYCGEEKLTCEGGVPKITMNDIKYRILDWDNTTQIVTVARDDYWGDICLSDPKNNTFDRTQFQYDHDDELVNVTLFYCPSDTPPITTDFFGPTKCGDNKFVFYTHLPVNSYTGNCPIVVIPIFESNASLVHDNKISVALQNGFELNWVGNYEECKKCSDSGGACGFNDGDGEFQCFCKDGSASCTGMSLFPFLV
ncbi:unnamed protein product [Sphenostylis stenocarpa]|uniref:Wall-associated receptor kinase C-terminal domain-containing protein n=1 Tax=Sphenostylis stenocarpa TaxID=92480 RepID=A0AA86V1X9_9FABA|nr:unnamed protein product [Sphenostylis stenocarpa]